MKRINSLRQRKNALIAVGLKVLFTAFRKTSETEEILKNLESDVIDHENKRIRCPHCRWQPAESSRWVCWDCDYPEYFYGGCGASWNTFETGGVCPGCAHRWIWTSCLRCGEWSRHEDWYAKE